MENNNSHAPAGECFSVGHQNSRKKKKKKKVLKIPRDDRMPIVVILPKLGADFTFATDSLKFSIERFL